MQKNLYTCVYSNNNSIFLAHKPLTMRITYNTDTKIKIRQIWYALITVNYEIRMKNLTC